MTPLLLIWLATCCHHFNVEPPFAQAVFQVESGCPGHQYRLGRLGRSKFAGPAGLHIAYVREKFGVDACDPWDNILIGVRALRGRDKVQVLKRFNPEWRKDRYLACVMAKMRELKRKP